MAVDVACPSQEVEGRSAVNADFWHETRELLRKRYGQDLGVLGWCGAAGDQSPHLMFNRAAEARMLKLRGLTRLEEIARRIDVAVDEANAAAQDDIRTDMELVHPVRTLELPTWQVTDAQYAAAKSEVDRLSKDPANHRRMLWRKKVVDRYEQLVETTGAGGPSVTPCLEVVIQGSLGIACHILDEQGSALIITTGNWRLGRFE